MCAAPYPGFFEMFSICVFPLGVMIGRPSRTNGSGSDTWGPKKECAVRESNPGLVRGRDLYYHCTNGACVFVPGIEPGTPRELDERHNQLDHAAYK